MMSENANTNDADARRCEELIAYLDGELSADRAAVVEQQLSTDEAYRSDLQQLSAVWDCLDELPRTSVDEKFARSTVAMVALSAERDLANHRAGAPRRWLLLAVAGAALMLVGYAAAAIMWPSSDDRLLADLPVVANLDLYQQIDDLQFAQRLARDVPWNDEPPIGAPAFYFEASTDAGATAARRQWIEVLSDDSKADLKSRRDRFAKLSPSEQQRLRDLHAAIMQKPNAQRIVSSLGLYQQWLQELSPGQRDDLYRLSPDDRAARVRELLKQDRRREGISARLEEINEEISTRDQQAVRDWMRNYLREHGREIIASLPPQRRVQIERQMNRRGAGGRGREPAMWRMLLAPRLANDETIFQSDELRELAGSLSREARQRLRDATSPEERERLARKWIQQSMQAAMLRRHLDPRSDEVREQDLETFFAEELTSEDRERLLKLPREQMKSQLRRLYLRDALGVDINRGPGRPSRDGTGRRGPPGGLQDGRRGDGPPRGPRRGGPGRGGPGRDGPPPRSIDSDRPEP